MTDREPLPAQWVDVPAPGLGVMPAAVVQPPGAGPSPVVLLLHGTHGFAQQYVQLAQDLARGGLLAVAAGWFSGSSGAGSRFVTPIACPDAPPMPEVWSPEAMQIVETLIAAARALPGARPDRVALFGQSRGARASLHYILGGGDVRAAILNSGGYPSEVVDRVTQIKMPILLLHGTADSPADGGSEFTDVRRAPSNQRRAAPGGRWKPCTTKVAGTTVYLPARRSTKTSCDGWPTSSDATFSPNVPSQAPSGVLNGPSEGEPHGHDEVGSIGRP